MRLSSKLFGAVTRQFCSTKISKQPTRNVMSPIFYVNAQPHIGHMYTAVYCDAVHRFNCHHHNDSFFSIGTDEHGLKIQKKATILGYDSPKTMCDENAAQFARLFDISNVNSSTFIRTTEPRHRTSVEKIWR